MGFFCAKNFSSLGQVDGIHSNNIQAYSFLDQDGVNRTQYYRLKSVDLDASYAYSEIISVQPAITRRILAYPNPIATDGLLTISDALFENALVQVEFYDINGRSVGQREVRATGDSFQLALNNFQLPKGQYAIKYTIDRRFVGTSSVIVR